MLSARKFADNFYQGKSLLTFLIWDGVSGCAYEHLVACASCFITASCSALHSSWELALGMAEICAVSLSAVRPAAAASERALLRSAETSASSLDRAASSAARPSVNH